jgi:hypothetical protein
MWWSVTAKTPATAGYCGRLRRRCHYTAMLRFYCSAPPLDQQHDGADGEVKAQSCRDHNRKTVHPILENQLLLYFHHHRRTRVN